ncbi:hypothetical protein GEMRC1_011599 [Eukaryota sp. GEM-RC1]
MTFEPSSLLSRLRTTAQIPLKDTLRSASLGKSPVIPTATNKYTLSETVSSGTANYDNDVQYSHDEPLTVQSDVSENSVSIRKPISVPTSKRPQRRPSKSKTSTKSRDSVKSGVHVDLTDYPTTYHRETLSASSNIRRSHSISDRIRIPRDIPDKQVINIDLDIEIDDSFPDTSRILDLRDY